MHLHCSKNKPATYTFTINKEPECCLHSQMFMQVNVDWQAWNAASSACVNEVKECLPWSGTGRNWQTQMELSVTAGNWMLKQCKKERHWKSLAGCNLLILKSYPVRRCVITAFVYNPPPPPLTPTHQPKFRRTAYQEFELSGVWLTSWALLACIAWYGEWDLIWPNWFLFIFFVYFVLFCIVLYCFILFCFVFHFSSIIFIVHLPPESDALFCPTAFLHCASFHWSSDLSIAWNCCVHPHLVVDHSFWLICLEL